MRLHLEDVSRVAETHVYGFDEEYLNSPVSTTMMNSHLLKNADVGEMERLY